ncbi:MAG: VOC family protein [Candidatus Kaiserbacteria bacterium]|nr:MAG: VOC family protein [Candidatus Kaiserbacteria bacterium]
MNPVVHFEMPYENRDRMADFYSKAFGWSADKLGPEMGSYVVVHTTETDANNMVKTPGAINGGFFERTKENQYPSVVISVDDIRAAMKRVEESGGKVIGARTAGEPDEIPGVGLYISIEDSEGNRVSLLQPARA